MKKPPTMSVAPSAAAPAGPPPPPPAAAAPGADHGLVGWGWTALLFYLTCGIGLEAAHGFKAGWYLDVGHETRRLMLTLGHAHGTLLAVITIVAGLVGRSEPRWAPARDARAALRVALVLLPGGFLLGGMGVRGGDPGPAVWLVPLGALALLYAVGRIAWRTGRRRE